MSTLWKVLTRKKFLDPSRVEESSLARVLNTFDLTALGVGSTLGVGMYVLVGKVARETAGPAVVVSFLIAAVASAFAGLCYAEFGARTPKAGSAYIYSYVTVGEFIAFIIGWNLILEYIIGSASVARGMSLYVDALVNNTIKDTFREIAPINVSFLSPYFDFLAFGIAVLLSVGLAFGMKESSKANNVFTILNIVVVLFVVVAGSFEADPKNWSLPGTAEGAGDGGFLPFGVAGMIKGAATCFYGFVGFDCIATTGEEVKNPQKAIPFAIIISLAIVFIAYFSTSTVVTLMVPYYLQDVNSPIPHAFEEFGWQAAKWIVTIGGIFALCASLFGAMFPLPRIIYAMASDGLIFKFLGKVSERFSTPVIGTLLAGLLTGTMGALIEQGQLVDMMSIGTLLAYTMVAACVLKLRYSVDDDAYTLVRADSDSSVTSEVNPDFPSEDSDDNPHAPVTLSRLVKQMFNCMGRRDLPTRTSEKVVSTLVIVFCILCLLLGLCAKYLVEPISHGEIYAIVLPAVVGGLMIVNLMMIGSQPTSKRTLSFKVPLVPVIPALSILVNIYLMLSLDVSTWIRFGVWMGIALCYEKAGDGNMVRPPEKVPHINNGFVPDDGLLSGKKALGAAAVVAVSEDVVSRLGSILEGEAGASQVNVEAVVHHEDEPDPGPEPGLDQSGVSEVVDELRRIVEMEEEKLISEAANGSVIEVIEDPFGTDVASPRVEVVEFLNEGIAGETDVDELVQQAPPPAPSMLGFEKFLRDSNTIIVPESKEVEIATVKPLEETASCPPPPSMLGFEKFLAESKAPLNAEEDVAVAAASLGSKEEVVTTMMTTPPPPPMSDFEKFKSVRIPRVDSTARKQLKPVIPPPDYRETKPHDDVPDVDGVVSFGSRQHAKIKDKLSSMLVKRAIGRPPPLKLTRTDSSASQSPPKLIPKKPIMDQLISEIPREAKNDDDDDDKDDAEDASVEDIKAKLNKLFGSEDRPKPLIHKSFPSHIHTSRSTSSAQIHEAQENHRRLMQGPLSSITSLRSAASED